MTTNTVGNSGPVAATRVRSTSSSRSKSNPSHRRRKRFLSRAHAATAGRPVRLTAEMHSGILQCFDVDPEVAFHVLDEVNQGKAVVHFEDKHERPFSLVSGLVRDLRLEQTRKAKAAHEPVLFDNTDLVK